jgi:hypothetical protein
VIGRLIGAILEARSASGIMITKRGLDSTVRRTPKQPEITVDSL